MRASDGNPGLGSLGGGNEPCAFVVEESVGALLEFFCDVLRLFVTLEPCLVLFVEAPTLVLQRLGGQVLLIRSLTVVEQIEQCIRINPASIVQSGVVEDG